MFSKYRSMFSKYRLDGQDVIPHVTVSSKCGQLRDSERGQLRDGERHVFMGAVHSARPLARSRGCVMKTVMEIKESAAKIKG